MKRDEKNELDAAVVFIKFGHEKRKSRNNDQVFIRLLDENKSRRKMLTLRISRSSGRISLIESTVRSSFFFENNSEKKMASTDRLDIMKEMEQDYVGFWIMYRYKKVETSFFKNVSKFEKFYDIYVLIF